MCHELLHSIETDDGSSLIEKDMNILIVTHGSILKEILKYLVHDLNSEFLHKIDDLSRSAPNASVSRFLINIDAKTRTLLKSKCESLHEFDPKSSALCDL